MYIMDIIVPRTNIFIYIYIYADERRNLIVFLEIIKMLENTRIIPKYLYTWDKNCFYHVILINGNSCVRGQYATCTWIFTQQVLKGANMLTIILMIITYATEKTMYLVLA